MIDELEQVELVRRERDRRDAMAGTQFAPDSSCQIAP